MAPTLLCSAPDLVAPIFHLRRRRQTQWRRLYSVRCRFYFVPKVLFLGQNVQYRIGPGTSRRQASMAPTLFRSAPTRKAPILKSELGAILYGADMSNVGSWFRWRRELSEERNLADSVCRRLEIWRRTYSCRRRSCWRRYDQVITTDDKYTNRTCSMPLPDCRSIDLHCQACLLDTVHWLFR
jgi:hypothetical protein